jgi:hypothetical protein
MRVIGMALPLVAALLGPWSEALADCGEILHHEKPRMQRCTDVQCQGIPPGPRRDKCFDGCASRCSPEFARCYRELVASVDEAIGLVPDDALPKQKWTSGRRNKSIQSCANETKHARSYCGCIQKAVEYMWPNPAELDSNNWINPHPQRQAKYERIIRDCKQKHRVPASDWP